MAYISLAGSDGSRKVQTSVDLSELAEQEGVDALHSIVLDFDEDGRLLGLEVAETQSASCPTRSFASGRRPRAMFLRQP